MAEFTYNPVQTVNANQPVILNNSIPCNKGYVYHRNESGVVTLRGIVNNCNACFARYKVTFNANIAVPTGETVGPIAIAVSQSGEPILTSRAVVTPTAVDAYFNVTSPAIIDVPRGCCFDISVENISDSGDPINVQNANLVVERIA
jgi:hypothetical protein